MKTWPWVCSWRRRETRRRRKDPLVLRVARSKTIVAAATVVWCYGRDSCSGAAVLVMMLVMVRCSCIRIAKAQELLDCKRRSLWHCSAGWVTSCDVRGKIVVRTPYWRRYRTPQNTGGCHVYCCATYIHNLELCTHIQLDSMLVCQLKSIVFLVVRSSLRYLYWQMAIIEFCSHIEKLFFFSVG